MMNRGYSFEADWRASNITLGLFFRRKHLPKSIPKVYESWWYKSVQSQLEFDVLSLSDIRRIKWSQVLGSEPYNLQPMSILWKDTWPWVSKLQVRWWWPSTLYCTKYAMPSMRDRKVEYRRWQAQRWVVEYQKGESCLAAVWISH